MSGEVGLGLNLDLTEAVKSAAKLDAKLKSMVEHTDKIASSMTKAFDKSFASIISRLQKDITSIGKTKVLPDFDTTKIEKGYSTISKIVTAIEELSKNLDDRAKSKFELFDTKELYSTTKSVAELEVRLKEVNDELKKQKDEWENAGKRAEEALKGKGFTNVDKRSKAYKDIVKGIRLLAEEDMTRLTESKAILEEELRFAKMTFDQKIEYARKYNERILRDEKTRQKEQLAIEEQHNQTLSGAIAFSDSAGSINDEKKAIQYLIAARDNLSKSTADYDKILEDLNKRIQRHRISVEQLTTAEKNEKTLQPTVRNEYARLLKELDKVVDAKERLRETDSYKSGDADAVRNEQAILAREKDITKKIEEIRENSAGLLDEVERQHYAERAQAELKEIENVEKKRREYAKLYSGLSPQYAQQLVDAGVGRENIEYEENAIKRLVEQKYALDEQDKDYIQTINALDDKIEEHKRNIDELTKAEKARKEQEENKRSTYDGAKQYAREAKTTNELSKAIKYLEKARAQENVRTEEGKARYAELTEEIAKLRKEMADLNGEQENFHKKSSNLLNITDQLSRKLALLFSVSAITGYVNKLTEVRGEFELQQRSLQVLLGSKKEANDLWAKTAQLAVQSPFRVKELVTYTKQLAAYRVESEKLYETNKMLADISAGLGVDMQRLILAYGQVKAANYLRGTELRQFSEAGVNILKELADYYSIIENRTVRVGEVFERVSKRMVSFADVDKVLRDMTNAGGMFFQMQEQQAETLKGQMSNLKDSIDLMLNDIGIANEDTIKSVIGILKSIIDNWEKLVPVLKGLIYAFGLFKINSLLAAESLLKTANEFGIMTVNGRKGLTVIQASIVGWKKLTKTLQELKATMLGNWWFIAIAAVLEAAAAFRRYKKELDEVKKKYQELKKEALSIEADITVAINDKDLNKAKEELKNLSEFAKEEYGIEVNIDYKNASMDDVKNAFKTLKEQIDNTSKSVSFLEWQLVNFNNVPFRKDLDKEIGEANVAFNQAAIQVDKYAKAVADATLQSVKTSDAQKKAAKDLLIPKGELETELQYMRRLKEDYNTIFGVGSLGILAQIGRRDKRKTLEGFLGFSIEDLVDAVAESENELNQAGHLFKKFLTDTDWTGYSEEQAKNAKKTWIDNTAGIKGWTEGIIEYLYEKAGLIYEINKNTNDDLVDFESEQDKANNLLNERIRLLKDLRAEYLKLNKTFGESESEQRTIDSYRAAFEAAGMNIDEVDFTTEEGLIASLKKLEGLAAKAGTKAKIALQRAIGDVQIGIDVKSTQEQQKDVIDNIEEMFGNYEISLEMEKLNIPPDLAKQLFGVDAISLDDIRSEIKAKLTEARAVGGREDYVRELEGELNKVKKLEDKQLKERLKTYTKYLREEQDERIKIKLEEIRKLEEVESMNEYNDAQKATIKANIRAEAEKDVMKKSWESFEQSPDFLNLFDDISRASTQSLEDMHTQLDMLKGSMMAANLPASELKEILDKINQVEEELENRKPFQSIKEDWSTLFGSDYKKALDDEKTLLEERRRLEAEKKSIEDSGPDDFQLNILNTEKEMLSSMEKGSEEYRQQKELVDSITKSLYPNQERYEEILKLLEQNGVKLDEAQQKTRKWKDSCEDIADHFNAIGDAVSQVGSALGTTLVQMGLMSEETKAIHDSYMSVADNAFSLGGNIMRLIANPADPQAWVGAITSTISMIGNIAAAGDAVREKEIQAEMKKVDRLEKAYEKLEKAMEDAYTIDQMRANKTSMEQNIDAQIKALESANAKEEAMKKKDQDQIDANYEKIAELEEKKAELQRETVERLGGTYDYASVAEQFLDAWLEAFKETGDGLSGLEDNFDEFFSELVKKQLIYGGITKLIEPLQNAINADLGDNQQIDKWGELIQGYEDTIKNIHNFLTSAVSNLESAGLNIFSGDGSELSGLSKGIQGITETQADILAAYWNAVRFDVSAIRQRFDDFMAMQGMGDEVNPVENHLKTISLNTTAMLRLLEDARGDSEANAIRVKVLNM